MAIRLEQVNKDTPFKVKKKYIANPDLLTRRLVELEENYNVLEWRIVDDNLKPIPQGGEGQWLKQVTRFSNSY